MHEFEFVNLIHNIPAVIQRNELAKYDGSNKQDFVLFNFTVIRFGDRFYLIKTKI